jgi:hypothetical protein
MLREDWSLFMSKPLKLPGQSWYPPHMSYHGACNLSIIGSSLQFKPPNGLQAIYLDNPKYASNKI